MIDISPDLLDPDAPVHPPTGMTVDQCRAIRARMREQLRREALAELDARRAGRMPSRAQLAAEDRAAHRIHDAEQARHRENW